MDNKKVYELIAAEPGHRYGVRWVKIHGEVEDWQAEAYYCNTETGEIRHASRIDE